MIIVDEPYISGFLLQTIADTRVPVLDNAFAQKHISQPELLVSDKEAVKRIVKDNELLYTSSENAIGWIDTHLQDTGLPEKIRIFKEKARFRKLIAAQFPDFYFKKVAFEDLRQLDFDSLPLPFVIKPNVGFFSLGVHRIDNRENWQNVLDALDRDVLEMNDIYPTQVMNASEFIIESYIEGPEYAVDCYFDAKGNPVLMNIMEHIFSSKDDVSDRLYYTSKKIVTTLKDTVLRFLTKMNQSAGLRNFPLHIEIRITDGTLIPIEGNPMRFGGWCTTADMAYKAFGFNPYLYFLQQKVPDWEQILKKMDDSYYSLILLTNNTGLDNDSIEAFNYEKLRRSMEDPLEIREIDHHKFPIFGFLFARTSKKNYKELEHILTSDLREFVIQRAQ